MSTEVNYTYLYFDIKDYSNTSVLTSYSLDITPLKFIPDYTTSELVSGARSVSNKILRWDFGDGTFSTDLTATHQYQWPGEYRVRLTIYDRYGNAHESTYKPTVKIRDFVCQDFVFADYGKFVYDVPASRIIDPLEVIFRDSWQTKQALSGRDYTISLYASGAAGEYQNLENFYNDKWSHLRLLSRFYIKQKFGNTEIYTLTDTLSVNVTEIYTKINDSRTGLEICSKDTPGSVYAGVTGSEEFYYVDDKTKNYTSRENPIFIFATLNNNFYKDRLTQYQNLYNYITPPPIGYQSLRPAVQPIIKVRHNSANRLSISTTGIDGEGTLSATPFTIPEITWQCTEVPFVVKFKDEENYTTKTYPPLSSSMVNTLVSNISAFDLKLGIISKTQDGHRPVNNIQYFEDFEPQIPQSTGGFYKGFFVANETAENCALTAQVTVIDPVNFPKDSIIGYISIPQFNYILKLFREQKFNSCGGTVSMTLTATQEFIPTTVERNVLAISVAPSGAGKGRDYESWLADSVTDCLFQFDLNGNTVKHLSLSACPTLINNAVVNVDYRSQESDLIAAAPGSIALDSQSNIWCALVEAGKCIKVDTQNYYVTHTADPGLLNTYYLASAFGVTPQLSGYAGEGLFLPVSIDTDRYDNLWVAYTHPVSNFIVKYDTYGTLLTAIPLPPIISPVEFCIDRDQYVWLTAINLNVSGTSLTGRNDFLYKFDRDGNIVNGFPLTGFRMIGPITVDGSQNAWVAHDRDTIAKIDHLTSKVTNYQAGSGNATTYVGSIVGFTCDTSDYLWVVNDFDKKIYIFDTLNMSESAFQFISYVDLSYPPESPLFPASAFSMKQFQAYGDWFGFRWINKYMVPHNIVRTITGTSNTFNIYSSAGAYNIAKINEDYDLAGFYKDIRYQEVLLDKKILFDDFIGTIVGDLSSQPYELGKTVNEKIANFTSNRVDPDKCNVDSLLSICTELLAVYEDYNYPFPPQLRRIVDLLSIKHKVLWGETNKYNYNFDGKSTIPPNDVYGVNLGKELSTLTDVITSGQPIVAYEKFSREYRVVNELGIPSYSLSSTLPLSGFTNDWGWGLILPPTLTGSKISDYYRFYEFIPTYNNAHLNNVINWYDPHTTLQYVQSSYEDWSKNNGIMQAIISYELSKGLGLFTSAANITYNN